MAGTNGYTDEKKIGNFEFGISNVEFVEIVKCIKYICYPNKFDIRNPKFEIPDFLLICVPQSFNLRRCQKQRSL
jgi:hypothetical protein